MKPLPILTAIITTALVMAHAHAPASAQTRRQLLPGPSMGGSSNCWAVGQKVAASQGGELMKASPVSRGGGHACLVVLVVRDAGQRPRRIEMVVPMN